MRNLKAADREHQKCNKVGRKSPKSTKISTKTKKINWEKIGKWLIPVWANSLSFILMQ